MRELVISHYKEHKSEREIITMLKLSKTTIHDIISKYRRTGNVKNLPRIGRPRATSSRQDRVIQRKAVYDRRIPAAQIVADVKDHFGVVVTPQTIRNRLHEVGLYGRRARKKPLLRRQNKTKRLIWARERKNTKGSAWDEVLWSDEKKFSLFNSDGRQYVWRRPGEALKEECLTPTVAHGGGSILVWGCFSAKGVGNLVKIDEIMTKEVVSYF